MTDPSEYYPKLAEQLEAYFDGFKRKLELEFQFEYINTGSSKWLCFVLNQLQSLSESGGAIDVIWSYEADDEKILMTGEILKSLVSFPFNLNPLN